MVGTETGRSSAEERVMTRNFKVLERKVSQAMEEGGVLDQLVEGLAVMKGEEREKMMQMYEVGMPKE